MPQPLILASKSPRRAKILESLGVRFAVAPAGAEEVSIPEQPRETVLRNALAKLRACRASHPGRSILAADTIVWCNGRIYGKPRDAAEAAEFLRELSGVAHTVFTGVAFCREDGAEQTAVAESTVAFRNLDDAAIADYIARVNPLDRAGAYDIDESGDLLVASLSGEYENVMGLPVEPLRAFLAGCGGADRSGAAR